MIDPMTPDDLRLIRQCLPAVMPFPYYPDRESAWLLAQHMLGDRAVSELRARPEGRLLDRPRLRGLVAGCGGVLRQAHVTALAFAEDAPVTVNLSRAGLSALDAVYGETWMDFSLTLSSWGQMSEWQDYQISRPGRNMVLQLGFPSDHAAVFGRLFEREDRRKYETYYHPVRRTGAPTLAWARLDIDLASGTALIEEVQCDWLRFAARQTRHMAEQGARDRDLRVHIAYEQALTRSYAKLWPRAILLAALIVLRQEIGIREVWMHQPEAGAVLKHITTVLPPRSLYTALPKSFGFQPETMPPPFLLPRRRKDLRRLGKSGGPLFWKLDFDALS